MFERFTTSARDVVVAAQEEALGLGHDQVLAEHLLIAVLASPEPGAARLRERGVDREAVVEQLRRLGPGDEDALRTIGVDLSAVRASVEATFGPGALDRAATRTRRRFSWGTGGSVRFSEPAKRALVGSLRVAVDLDQGEIGAGHLLVALLDPDEPGARTLTRLGVDPAAVRAEVLDGLRG
jgi:ATP-dependent Clp protease ATP-binding subunit ClpA